ncbi:MAG: class IV adenylate cyclase [Candidatus Binatia bacterium]
MARNVEIKARVGDLSRIRERARALGARPAGVLAQTDRYYEIDGGRRVKLREIDGACFELIHYDRPERDGVRTSDYTVERFAAGDPTLAEWRGRDARCVVAKTRELLLLDNVRIHLDRVDGLGTFLELEAVLDDAHDERSCRVAVERLLDVFGIERGALLRASYSDLLGSV